MVTVRFDGLDRIQRALSRYPAEQRKAARNALNDTARDVQKRNQKEINRVFHRPTRIIQNAFYVKKATTENLQAEVKLKDVYGESGRAIPNTLQPHIPGYSANRSAKGMEIALRSKGLLGSNEFLVPSRTMRLDSHGNVTGATASKMLNDLWVFSNVAGFNSNTGSARSKYIWGEIMPQGKPPIKGIWLTSRFLARKPGALMMLVVQGAPSYGKRFRFFEIGNKEAKRQLPRHAQIAIEHALRRISQG